MLRAWRASAENDYTESIYGIVLVTTDADKKAASAGKSAKRTERYHNITLQGT
jgi:hypothetical protein